MYFINLPDIDWTDPLIIGLCILAFVLLSAVIATFIIAHVKVQKKAYSLDFNTRVYTYNYEKGLFYFFDQNNISCQKIYKSDEFFSQYIPTDANRMKVWISDVVTKNDFPPFIQADVKLSRKGKIYTTMVEVLSVNRKKSVIHFQSHLLPYMGTTSMKAKKTRHPKNLSKYILEDENRAQDFLDSGKVVEVIGIYFLKIYRSTNHARPDEQAYLKRIFNEALLSISHFFSKSCKFYKVSDTEIVIIDKEAISKPMVMNIGSSINTQIQQYLNFNVPDVDLYIGIGITSGAECGRNFKEAIHQSGEMAKAISNNYTNEKILQYDPMFYEKYHSEQKNIEDITMLVKNSTFRVYFNATFNLKTREQSFYTVKAIPYGTSVHDFSEALLLATKTSYGVLPLLRSLNEKCERILRGKKNTGVMIQMPFSLLKSFVLALEDQNEKNDLDWILAIQESELIAQMNHLSTLRQTLQNVLDARYKIALILYHSNSSLPSSLLRHFSYFIINKDFSASLTDSKTQSELKMAETNYSNFPALLTYTDLKDFNSFELAAHFGGKILQCEQLSPTSSRADDIDKDKLKDLLTRTDALIPSKGKSDFLKIEKLLRQKNN